MYPRILQIPLPFEILGVDAITIYSFGAMMAVAFLTAAWLTRHELDRMYNAGHLKAVRVPVKKGQSAGRRQSKMDASPSYLVGPITVIAVVGGICGAKLFHILENLGDFFADPLGMIFSTGGLTFYGGLIVAAVSIFWYVRRYGIRLSTFADATLPTVLLAYGIGRIGCHLAGDGDWGIASDPAARPSFIPKWLWGETYPNNILERVLPESGVYPTSLYEFGMALALFGVLWALRRHPHKWGWLFSLALVFFGAERFLIEQIRVNNSLDVLGLVVTQAEVISTVLLTIGVIGLVRTTRRRQGNVASGEQPSA